MRSLIYLPPQFTINGKLYGNPIFQLRQPEAMSEEELADVKVGRSNAERIIKAKGKDIIVVRSKKIPAGSENILISPDGEVPKDEKRYLEIKDKMHWLRPKDNIVNLNNLALLQRHCENVRKTWKGRFVFVEEERENGIVVKHGLRSAQTGALYATLGYWKSNNKPATIVMPTGTGKTETMLSLLVKQRLERVLVVVPTDALRTQIANKFITLGLLKQFGVVSKNAAFPVVGQLKHRLNDANEIEQFFKSCNVIITTMSIISGFDEILQKKIADLCTHLFIDEAHHITAPTWEKFRRHFIKKTILQFTATPFRSDGRHVDGKQIFTFPLKKAQDEGYFKPINFVSLREYNPQNHDETLAKAAIAQLNKDRSSNLDHILMARVDNINRAKEVFKLYKTHGTKYNPVLLHSRQTEHDKKLFLEQLTNKNSRIVVCVDMFGEGFDLPELKIAALHDVHKSLGITLQFTGRFTRSKDNIGEATILANIANAKVTEAIRNLYAEDADWNSILRNLSEGATTEQEKRTEFLGGFVDLPPELPLQNILPKMSTVVYRTNCANWEPEKIRNVIKESTIYAGPTVNNDKNVMLFVTRVREPVDWANMKDVYNTVWNLYLFHWNPTQKLLYINSSHKGYHEPLAKAVAGDDVDLIRGEQVFRTLHGINRLTLMNLGLKHAFSRAARFTMHVGSDIRQGLPEAQTQNKIKSNLFGTGFENGQKASIGCSNKGKLWAYRVADSLSEWVEWCEHVGTKLQDNSIQVDNVLDNAIIPKPIQVRPNLVPLNIEWSEDRFMKFEEVVQLDVAGDIVPFYDAGLELTTHTQQGPIKFRIFTENKSAEYELKINNGKVSYVPLTTNFVYVIEGSKKEPLGDWFQKSPPTIRFEDGTYLIYNEIYSLKNNTVAPFDKNKIDAWNWQGVDLSQESQTFTKKQDSIQYHVLQQLLSNNPLEYDIIFDDDDAHEAADIIAIKVVGERLIIHFYHCKFSSAATPGARIEDLYEVCGQAQKSVLWKGDIKALLQHMRIRDVSRVNKHNVSRFEKGDMMKLDELENQIPFLIPEFKISIVQPGVSKANITDKQLTLLAVTESYLMDTYLAIFGVITSA